MADFKQNYFQRRTKDRGPRSNNRISSPDVQVIASDGENLGVLNTNEAISMAKNQGLDLIEIAPNANPPVCKIMDMGKYKYDAQKKANLAKKKQKIVSLKEIKMRPVTETHDYEFKSSSLLIDISLHLGSLIAIIYFFKDELFDIRKNKRILNLIVLGSIPLIIVGYILYSTNLIYQLRNLEVIAWTTLIFAIILYISDKNRFDKKISSNLNFQSIIFIGVFQIFSLVPGVSRAGITITAARILKFNRVDSSKISFLLSIPALAGASVLSLKDVFEQSIQFNYLIVIAIISSFIFSFLTVKFFLIYINKFSMNAFVIYRIIIALILFSLIY